MPPLKITLRPFLLAAVLAGSHAGCSGESPTRPDRPLPVPDGGVEPPPSQDGGHPTGSGGMGGTEGAGGFGGGGGVGGEGGTCVPDPCSGVILDDRIGPRPNQRMCLSFTESSATLGLQPLSGHLGLSVVDINQDGWQDLFVFGKGVSNRLWRSNGGSFIDATSTWGLDFGGDTRDAAWGDYDNDGDPDLLLVTDGGSKLYQNTGATMSLLSGGLGIDDGNSGKTAAWIGQRVLIATTNGAVSYLHQGGDIFIENTNASGLSDFGEGASLAVADYDGDGLQDFYLANSTGFPSPGFSGTNRLFRQEADGTFTSRELATLTDTDDNNTAAAWVLRKDETLPSLYVGTYNTSNHFFINPQTGGSDDPFTDQATALGLNDPGQTTRIAWGDPLQDANPSFFDGRWQQQNIFWVPKLDPVTGQVTDYVDRAFPVGMAFTALTIGAAWIDVDHANGPDLAVATEDGILKLFVNQSDWVGVCP